MNPKVGGQEETQFHTVVCWEGLAETVSTYVRKGDPLYVEGRLQYRSFPDEEGRERGVVEIVASDVQFLGRRHEMSVAAAPTTSDRAASPEASSDERSPEEIPF